MHENGGGPSIAMIVQGRHWNHDATYIMCLDRTPRITWLFGYAFPVDKK